MSERFITTKEKNPYIKRRIGAVAALAGVAAGVIAATHPTETKQLALDVKQGVENVIENLGPQYEYSDSLDTYTVGSGEGIWDVVRHVDGYESGDLSEIANYINELPENAAIYNKSGFIEYGTQIYYPTSVEVS